MDASIVIIGILVVGILLVVMIFNSLVVKRNGYKKAFAGIDAQLKRRFDLIPNLVDSISRHMTHEKEVLTEITKLRSQSLSGDLANRSAVDGKLSQALKGIMVAVENYPDLKSNQNFIQLQDTLSEIEANLSAARRNYNSAVTDYNNGIHIFPNNILAGMMGFRDAPLFEIPDSERANVSVSNLFKKGS